ncbi:MAG: rRNA maturation RNase YbeY [Magnetococcales bacterium]|nr:rRNA maturation RNase YbeY [Magnetococcales bacterium]MBF0346870.1 rRNA maturation RNase YbeY [Magnetococcales bacterium]MBF0630871.1 rRNA maturation RNase YbeY [Magnetococcales bacterium]
MKATVRVSRERSRWPKVEKKVRQAALAVLERVGGMDGAEVAVRLTHDEEVQSLNLHYRGIDRPTNILSFAMMDDPDDIEFPEAPLLLGDLVLAFETVVREAEMQGKTFEDHLTHLVVHGMLHLLGYDHERSPEDALRQETMEIAILAHMGIDNPYE